MDKIGSVTIDTTYFTGQNRYSDGLIEHELLQLVRQAEPDFRTALSQDQRWPLLYHLTPLRRNLLEWYPFDAQGSILEIGAGCGALTGLFCEKAAQVVALELSRLRAEIIAWRYRENSNLQVVVGDLLDTCLTTTFDYVTLIGVLEYATGAASDESRFRRLLDKARSYLKPDGVLLVALENKYGLKYWAGAPEDHTGVLFDGLQGYRGDVAVRTFSRAELETMLKDSGFHDLTFYYPVPDYKLPVEIFSDANLPRYGQCPTGATYSAPRLALFDEDRVRNTIIDSGDFAFFANSFLVCCRQETP